MGSIMASSELKDTIYYTLVNTPWWVYVLLVYLIYIGLKASKPNQTPIIKLAIIPLIFLYLSVESLINETNLHPINITTYAIALVVGIVFGYLIAQRIGAQIVKKNNLTFVQLPGSKLSLILILIIFASKYYVGYKIAVNPEIIHNFQFTITILIIYGVTAGLFVGRFMFYLRRVFENK
ncbi:hypothetical protein L3V86_01175 [Thiotrichales bacterium 19S11-10]|nr:hypothetical protein [Thiotrichales bacterium 19S11-10]